MTNDQGVLLASLTLSLITQDTVFVIVCGARTQHHAAKQLNKTKTQSDIARGRETNAPSRQSGCVGAACPRPRPPLRITALVLGLSLADRLAPRPVAPANLPPPRTVPWGGPLSGDGGSCGGGGLAPSSPSSDALPAESSPPAAHSPLTRGAGSCHRGGVASADAPSSAPTSARRASSVRTS